MVRKGARCFGAQSLATLALALVLVLVPGRAFVVDVPPRSSECFLMRGLAGEEMHFQYEVFEGGFLDIDVKVTDDRSSAVVFEKKRSTGEQTGWDVDDDTEYRFCFSNRISTLAHKKISFSLYRDENVRAPAEKKHMDPLHKLAVQIEEGVHDAKTKLNYMAMRENTHEQTNEATNWRVSLLTGLEITVVLLVCTLQVFVLKRFFERKTRI